MTARRLIVMRHAKSSWSTGEVDHSRPLNKRGRVDAPKIGQRLLEMGWVPEWVLSSDSVRTRQTWDGLAKVIGTEDQTVRFLHHFYHGGVRAAESELEALSPSVRSVLILGHNPGWESVVANLCGKQIQMTTANAVLLETEAPDWVDAIHQARLWRVCGVLRPREPRTTPR